MIKVNLSFSRYAIARILACVGVAVIPTIFVVESKLPLWLEIVFTVFLAIWIIYNMRKAEAAYNKLQEINSKQKLFINNISKYSSDIVICKDKNLKIVAYNRQLLKTYKILHGEEKESLEGLSLQDIASPEIALTIESNDMKAMGTKKSIKYILENTKSGKIHEIVTTPIENDGIIDGVITIARDITERERLREQLKIKKQEMDCLFDNMPFLAILKDSNGNYIRSNYCAKSVHDAIALRKREISTKFYASETFRIIQEEDVEIVRTKESKTYIKQMEFVENNPNWYKIDKIPIVGLDGEVNKIAVFLQNINEEIAREKRKDTFVASLTHDLKNPTLAQINALKLFKNGNFGKITHEQEEIVDEILNSCDYMLKMILTIIDSYKADDDKLSFTIEKFDICKLINNICKENYFLIEENNQKLNIKSSVSCLIINSDSLQLKRVISNLLSNAIIYGEKNSDIKIILEDFNDEIALKIISSGAYLPTEKIDSIFDRYNSKLSNGNKISSGLGLYLSKRIVEGLGGSMFAQSTPDGTNCFGFKLYKNAQTTDINQLENKNRI